MCHTIQHRAVLIIFPLNLQSLKQDKIITVFRIVWFLFAKIKGAKIILHAKSPTFRAAKIKGFTVALFEILDY